MAGSRIHLRLGTRGSLLARAQSEQIAEQVRQAHRDVDVELIEIKTSGDQITDKPLYEFGGKGLFTKEIEQALLDNAIDFAVHSLKDVPVTMPLVDQSDLIIAAVPKREDARDVLISQRANTLGGLATGARVGTSSLRRRCQALALRNDLELQPVRGNIDTRIRKLKNGEFDAIILAMAGLKRAKLFDETIMHAIEFDHMLPAPGQGAIAIQCRRNDAGTIEILGKLNDPPTRLCTDIEREVVRGLSGDCHSPIAAFARLEGSLTLQTAIGARDGGLPVIRVAASAPPTDPNAAVLSVLTDLKAQGALELLRP